MIYCIIIAAIASADLITKYAVAKKLPFCSQKEIIKNLLYFINLRNRGAAMGYMSDKPKRLLAVTGTMTAVLAAILTLLIVTGKFAKYCFLLSVLIGGALGNFIDRLKNGYVTDFIYFKIGKLPVFNVADLFIFTTPVITIACLFV